MEQKDSTEKKTQTQQSEQQQNQSNQNNNSLLSQHIQEESKQQSPSVNQPEEHQQVGITTNEPKQMDQQLLISEQAALIEDKEASNEFMNDQNQLQQESQDKSAQNALSQKIKSRKSKSENQLLGQVQEGQANDSGSDEKNNKSQSISISMNANPNLSTHEPYLMNEKFIQQINLNEISNFQMIKQYAQSEFNNSTIFFQAKIQSTQGIIPSPRSSHIAQLIVNDQIIIHGGTNNEKDLTDSFIYDINKKEWKQINDKFNMQFLLVGHNSIYFPYYQAPFQKQSILLFGGWDGKDYSNNIYLLDFKENTLRKSNYLDNTQMDSKTINSNQSKSGGNFLFLKIQDNLPYGRRDASFAYDKIHNCIYLYGGFNSFQPEQGGNITHIWKLTQKWRWERATTKGQIPIERKGHTCVITENPHQMIIYGGMNGFAKILDECLILDLETFTWSQLQKDQDNGYQPDGRVWHSAVLIDDYIYYIGGMKNHQMFTNEIIQYDVTHKKWNLISVFNSELFLPRCSHTSIYIPNTNQIIILGGLGPKDLSQNNAQHSDDQQQIRYDLQNIVILQLHNYKIKPCENKFLTSELLSPAVNHQINTKEIQLQWNTFDFPLDKECKSTIKDNQKNQISEPEFSLAEQLKESED